MISNEVLNKPLYTRLKKLFGKVRVSKEGEEAEYRAVYDVEGKPQLDFLHTGEYYQVCCPFCTDDRFRLFVNYLYGQTDPFGRTTSFLAVCYNDTACMSKLENVDALWEDISEHDDDYIKKKPKKGRKVPLEARETSWPGPCIKLRDLEDTHHAFRYVESRGFDPDAIGDRYDVRYCVDSHYYLCRDRLIIPVYQKRKLKGWQARLIGDWKKGMAPKYFTFPGMPRRSLIYNLDQAAMYETGIIMEGPTDVWAMGAMGVCTFGSTMTMTQQRVFFTKFKYRTAVLLYDPEEFEKAGTQKLIKGFHKRMPGKFAALKLPKGTDPGSLGRGFLRDFVYEEAKAQGVIVSYRKAA